MAGLRLEHIYKVYPNGTKAVSDFTMDIKDKEFIDILFAFYDTIGQYEKYKKFCVENGYYTAKGNCQLTAEICYRFVSNDTSFIEEHTALADSEIEVEILRACWATHRKFTRNAHKGDYVNKQIKCIIK